MGFGIFGCDVIRDRRRAVAVMLRVLAMLRKARPITMRLGGRCCSASTTFTGAAGSAGEGMPGGDSAVLCIRTEGSSGKGGDQSRSADVLWHPQASRR